MVVGPVHEKTRSRTYAEDTPNAGGLQREGGEAPWGALHTPPVR